MDILWFVATVILVTASGALAPGPLFVATITHGAQGGIRTGLLFAVAHTIVEFSLVLLFVFGLSFIIDQRFIRTAIGIAGGLVLLGFGLYQIVASYRGRFIQNQKSPSSTHHLFFIGMIFTGLNPYFIIWWFTVGAQLILIALEFAGIPGVIFMYISHVWMDYVWLASLAWFAHKGVSFLTARWYRYVMLGFGGILLYFGISFILTSL